MNRKHEARVLEIVKEYINSQIKTDTGQVLPVGYNPLEKIRRALFCWVQVPFNGNEIWCQLRCPNATQLEQCGDMTNIILDEKKKEKLDYDEIIQLRNYHESICKLVLNRPTYDNLLALVNEDDFMLSEKRKELEEIQKHYDENKQNMATVEKELIEKRIRILELKLGFILPDDTMSFLCKWAMGNDVSDIKKIAKAALLKAASLAKAYNKAPSEYLSGIYTDFNKHEIDIYAFAVLDEHLKEHQAAEEAKKGMKHKWLFGGSTKTTTNYMPKQPGVK